MRFAQKAGMVAASAALVWFCLPSGPLPWLSFVALVPIALCLRGLSARAGFFWGWLFGSLIWLTSTWWAFWGLRGMAGWGPEAAAAGTALFVLYQGLPYALFGWAGGWLRARGREPGPLLQAALLTLFSFILPTLCPGSVALALYSWPLAIQVADLGGTHLVHFALILANWQAACALAEFRRPAVAVARLAGMAVVVGGMLAYGAFSLASLDQLAQKAGPGEFLGIISVQPNLPVHGYKGIARAGRYAGPKGSMLKLSEAAAARFPRPDLLVWPEIPQTVDCACDSLSQGAAKQAARVAGAPLLLACEDLEYGPGKPVVTVRRDESGLEAVVTSRRVKAFYNGASLFEPDQACGPVYHKVNLVPFTEQIPPALDWAWLRQMMGRSIYYSPGAGPVLFRLAGGQLVQPLICFESGFPALVRRGVALGAGLLVNLSNDAWFAQANAQEFHLAVSVFRTVEVRRPLVSCTNSGFGAHVSATGRIVPGTLTKPWTRQSTYARLHCPKSRTVYQALGDWWLLGAAAFVLAVALARGFGGKSKNSHGRGSRPANRLSPVDGSSSEGGVLPPPGSPAPQRPCGPAHVGDRPQGGEAPSE